MGSMSFNRGSRMLLDTCDFSDQDLQKRLAFETLLSDISAQFIDLPIELIDNSIESAQRRICECLAFDTSTLWQWSADNPRLLTLTHMHSPADGPTRPMQMDAEQAFPWTYRKILKGLTFTIDTEELPKEAFRDRDTRRRYGIRFSVVIPLKAGGKPAMGVLSFGRSYKDKEGGQTTENIKRLELVAQIFCNALARKQHDQLLRESEMRLSLALHSAGAGIWEYDCGTRTFWATEKARAIFGFRPDEVIGMTMFEGTIHPDDFPGFRQVIDEAALLEKSIDIEFRIRIGAGLRWVCSRGRAYRRAGGKVNRLLGVSIDISEQKRLEGDLKERLAEVEALRQQLEGENLYLREELQKEHGLEQIVGESDAFEKVLLAGRQVAATDATVLILGETGTGKGVIANAIHKMSGRRARPLVTVNCAALPAGLIESELFGREKGAFTGAHARQAGRFEVADRGTIFLDEIGEMPLDLQAKLLRVLQDGEFERLGCTRTVKVDVRVIAATARDLSEEVAAGRFRQDLFYRLNVFPITIPPLRQRPEDIAPLTKHFIAKYNRKMGKRIDTIAKSTIDKLLHYQWPGNVRELEHLVERCVIVSPGTAFTLLDQLGPPAKAVPAMEESEKKDLASIERNHILHVLRTTEWKIEGHGGAASILDLHPSTLRFRIKKLGILRPL
ncbi:MAG TPA: Fis family transcriptional regulator [Desulfobulbaceae bacterium]|nr:Fis family transcriptional regulator [Desulfobulbaceae bacterium]